MWLRITIRSLFFFFFYFLIPAEAQTQAPIQAPTLAQTQVQTQAPTQALTRRRRLPRLGQGTVIDPNPVAVPNIRCFTCVDKTDPSCGEAVLEPCRMQDEICFSASLDCNIQFSYYSYFTIQFCKNI